MYFVAKLAPEVLGKCIAIRDEVARHAAELALHPSGNQIARLNLLHERFVIPRAKMCWTLDTM